MKLGNGLINKIYLGPDEILKAYLGPLLVYDKTTPPLVKNLVSCDSNTDTIYIHDGVSGTILNSFSSPSTYPYGLAFDGTNLISCDTDTDTIYIHDGISGTILNSFSSPGTFPTGLTFDGTNLISCDIVSDRIYIHNGITNTLLFDFLSPGANPQGLTFDGTNLIIASNSTNTIYVQDGVSSTVLTSFPSPSGAPIGLAFDGTNLISCDSGQDTIYIHDGVSGTILSSFSSPGAYPSGLTIVETTPPPNGLLNGLVSYYKADTSGSFPDAHGNNDGTINGATFTASGKINGGYSFDGVNDYVDIDTSATVDIDGAKPRTINMWINPIDNTVASLPFSYGLATTGSNFSFGTFDGGNGITWNFNGWDTAYIFYTDLLVEIGWQMVTYVYTGTQLRIYKNGVEASEYRRASDNALTNNVTLNTSQSNINIGRRLNGTDFWFNGLIDEIGVWNKALTQSEITELYNSSAGKPYNSFTT